MAKANRNAKTGQPANVPAVPAQAQEEDAARKAAGEAVDAGGAHGAGGRDPVTTDTTQPEKGPGGAPHAGASGVLLPATSGLDPAAHDQWPRLAAALEAWQAAHGAVGGQPLVRIASRFDEGFRRCGHHHSARPTEHDFRRWTPDQIEMLLCEPALKVELV